MRLANAMIAFAMTVTTVAAHAEPYRDKLPIPSHRLLGAMVVQFQSASPIDSLKKSLQLASPLIRGLDQKYGTGLDGMLRVSVQGGDRNTASAAVTMLVLLDAQDLLDGIKRDDNTGWAEATINTKKALLDFQLVTVEVRRKSPELTKHALEHANALLHALLNADMDTEPASIEQPRRALVGDLIALRGALGKKPLRD